MIEISSNKCSNCSNVSQNMQPYLTFPLHVEGMKTIQDSLNAYCKKEVVNGYECEKCKKKKNSVQVSKSILKLPDTIIFQM
mmetsp:Transcript_7375/g.5645  ORF Transcript_7375/g.5645 Transcript_7375/m.5645 type:complete len:81 (+) Transcript_7375:914-1156(+)